MKSHIKNSQITYSKCHVFQVLLILVATCLYSFRIDTLTFADNHFHLIFLGATLFFFSGLFWGYLSNITVKPKAILLLLLFLSILGLAESLLRKVHLPFIHGDIWGNVHNEWITHLHEFIFEFLIATFPLVISGWIIGFGFQALSNKSEKPNGSQLIKSTKNFIEFDMIIRALIVLATLLFNSHNYINSPNLNWFLVFSSITFFVIGMIIYLIFKHKPLSKQLREMAVLMLFAILLYTFMKISHIYNALNEWRFTFSYLIDFTLFMLTFVITGWFLSFVILWLNQKVQMNLKID
ncbi:MAG: hypothetical protein R3E90_07880 [Marinicella sp.]